MVGNTSLIFFVPILAILQLLTCPNTLEQNGNDERKKGQIMSVICCLLKGTNVPKFNWHNAIFTAIYLINRTPSRVLHGLDPLGLTLQGLSFLSYLGFLGALVLFKTGVLLTLS